MQVERVASAFASPADKGLYLVLGDVIDSKRDNITHYSIEAIKMVKSNTSRFATRCYDGDLEW